MSKLGKKIIERLERFVIRSGEGDFVLVNPDEYDDPKVFYLEDLKQLVQYMERLEEQDALELLREQG